MGTLLQDLRFATRLLRKSPGFAVAAVVTLALAIGANAVVFSVMNALILRPSTFPMPKASTGFCSRPTMPTSPIPTISTCAIAIVASKISARTPGRGERRQRQRPAEVWTYETSGNYFDALHLQPYLGRFFHAADEHGPDSAPYVVLSYGYWHSHFQEDRNVVGRRHLG